MTARYTSTAGEQEPRLASAGRRPAAASSDGGPAAGPNINDLPDDLLGLIFVNLVVETDMQQGRAVTEVCTRWKDVYYSASCIDLWLDQVFVFGAKQLEGADRIAASLRLWQRVGPLCETAIILAEPEQGWCQAAAAQLPAGLATLNPDQLLQLRVDRVPLTPAALQAVAQFSQLRFLAFSSQGDSAACSPDFAAVVGRLEGLEEFHFCGSCVHAELLAALCRLPGLSVLELQSIEAPLPDLSPLAALAGSLAELMLAERASSSSGLKLPEAACFPNLSHMSVTAPTIQVPGGQHIAVLQDEGISWEVGGEEDDEYGPPAPAASVQFQRIRTNPELMISNARLHGRGVAAAVLAAVAPGGIPTLGLQDCSMTAAAFEGCAAYLAATTRLVVYRCFGVGPSLTLAPPLGDIVSQTPQLRNLQVVCAATGSPSSSLFAGAPREIAGLRQLKTLQLVGAYLPHLEGVLEGLPDLSILDVQFNRLRRLPAALSRCTKLETLLLDGNMFLQLGATDSTPLKNVLASLPALKRLKLPGAPGAAELRQHLTAAAPHIEEIVVGDP